MAKAIKTAIIATVIVVTGGAAAALYAGTATTLAGALALQGALAVGMFASSLVASAIGKMTSLILPQQHQQLVAQQFIQLQMQILLIQKMITTLVVVG